jgi:hypothetical protein
MTRWSCWARSPTSSPRARTGRAGSRHSPSSSATRTRTSYCNQHHQLIDSEGALAAYTVERLTAMKEDHEKWVERTPGGRRNVAPELRAAVVELPEVLAKPQS